jgi:pimeloyl-ACP methyl ester carboxylesterase
MDKTNFGPETLDHYANNALRPGAMTAMINYYRALPRARAAFEATPKVETPTLLVWGEEDTALSIHLVEPHVNWVKDITIERLPGVSHWVQQEAPDRVNRALSLWLTTPRPA